MHRQRIYIDTSVIGGCFDDEFAEWSNKLFEEFIEGKNDDTMVFWRFLNLEMWLRIFFDKDYKNDKSYKVHEVYKVRKFGEPNEGKKLEIEVEGKTYLRFPVKTDLFKKGDDVTQKIAEYTLQYINIMKSSSKYSKLFQNRWEMCNFCLW